MLLKALDTSGTIGIAEFMLRNREHVCAVKAHNDVLLLNQMRYQEEIREVPEVEAPAKEKITAKELELAMKLVEQLTEKFNPAAFKDTYISELKKIIKAKAAGKQIRVAEEPKKNHWRCQGPDGDLETKPQYRHEEKSVELILGD